jgi:hypothetical protein
MVPLGEGRLGVATTVRLVGDVRVEFVRCRTYNHAWDEFYPTDMAPPAFGWRLSLRCIRCGAERHDLIDRKGSVMARRYIHPEGYLEKKAPGTDPWKRSDYRDALFERLRERLDKAAAIAPSFQSLKVVEDKPKTTRKRRAS